MINKSTLDNVVVIDDQQEDRITDHLVDLFAGCGGSGGGLLSACDLLDRQVKGTFVNHWDKAIEIHERNHPEHRHLREDLFQLDPTSVFPDGTRCSLLWASPQCTFFSVARGAACVTEQDRSHALSVTDWIKHLKPEGVLIENVKEFERWGPVIQKRGKDGELMWSVKGKPVRELDSRLKRRKTETEEQWIARMATTKHGQVIKPPKKKGAATYSEFYEPYMVPDKDREGEYFHAWIDEVKELGYNADWKLLKSADYGDPTIRTRLFVQFVRFDSGKRIVWPAQTHFKRQKNGMVPEGYLPWVTARDIIDWDLKGESVFARERPLAPNTFRRLAIGLVKYGLSNYLVQSAHGSRKPEDCNRRTKSPDEPLPTLTSKGEHGVVQPEGYMIPNFGERPGQTPRSHSVDDPVPTVTSHGAGGIVRPEGFVLPKDQGHDGRHVKGVDHPVSAVTTRHHEALIQQEVDPYVVPKDGGHSKRNVRSVDDPVSTLTTHHRGEMVVEPAVIQMKGQSTAQDVDEPLTSPTTNQSHYVMEPTVDHLRGTGVAAGVDEPLRSPTAGGNHQAISEAFMMAIDQTGGGRNHGCYSADEPVRTIVTKHNTACLEFELEEVSERFLENCDAKGVDVTRAKMFLDYLIDELKRSGKAENAKPWIYVYYSSGSEGSDIDEPLPTVRCKAASAVCYPVIELDGTMLRIDLFYRMLTTLELQRAMGFPDTIDWGDATKTDVIRAIGNSVSHGVAQALGLAFWSQEEDIRRFLPEFQPDFAE